MRSMFSGMLLTLIALGCCSCMEDNPPAPKNGMTDITHPEPWAGQRPVNNPPANSAPAPLVSKPVASVPGSPVPPKDAQFTIYVQDFTGPSHVDISSRFKNDLTALTNLHGWYLLHQEDHSSLFYGYYRDANESNALRDRAAVMAVRDRSGNAVFAQAMIVPVDAPDPVAPPEWNLATIRHGESDTQHFYTIQIAAYKDSPERKQAAVEAVKAARAQGIEAYYYHGDSISSVCIGCWPQSAARIEGITNEKMGIETGPNPDEQVMIAPGINVPRNIARANANANTPVVNPQVVIVDPSMAAIKQKYPDNAINGSLPVTRDKSGNTVMAPSPSLIVEIPVASAMMGLGSALPPVDPNPPPPEALRTVMPDKSQSTNGSGKLKSVDGR